MLTYFNKQKELWRDQIISRSLVGTGKPSPIIFDAALSAQGVLAEESLYVDDYKPEADGAREQGFASFFIDRKGENNEEWTIHSLRQLIDLQIGVSACSIQQFTSDTCHG